MTLSWRAVALVLLGLVPVALWPSMSTVRWWLLAVAVVVVVDLLLAPSPATVRVERAPTGPVRLGTETTSVLTVTNPGSGRIRGTLRDAWVPSAGASGERHTVDLPGGERRRFTTRLQPTRRGDRPADRVTVRTWGPLGIAGRQRSWPVPGVVRALPPFHSRRHLPSRLAHLRQLDGRSAVRTRGQGTEFDSLRDYVEGDDVRSIDWRATARRQHVVVRTWRPERDRRVVLVLDTSRTSAARVGDEPRLDAAMDAALLLAALASRAGDRVDLLAYDRRVRARVEGVSRGDLLPAMVQAMAPLEPELIESDAAGMVTAVLSRVRQRCLVVLLTELNAAALEEGLLPLLPHLTARHLVMVAAVSDPRVGEMARSRGDLAAVYDAAAAERARAERRRLTAELRRHGVEVVDAAPGDLAPALADAYLALKATGRL